MDLKIFVCTGSQRFAGTNANVSIILHGEFGSSSPTFQLDKFLRDDFKRGGIDDFKVSVEAEFGRVTCVELWRDSHGLFADWFLNSIRIENSTTGDVSLFGIGEWIKATTHYKFEESNEPKEQDASLSENKDTSPVEKESGGIEPNAGSNSKETSEKPVVGMLAPCVPISKDPIINKKEDEKQPPEEPAVTPQEVKDEIKTDNLTDKNKDTETDVDKICDVKDPTLPFRQLLGVYRPGRVIHIKGIPLPNPKRFTINLQSGVGKRPVIALHFDVRFHYGNFKNKVVRNSRKNLYFNNEELEDDGVFPFSLNTEFDIMMEVTESAFVIKVDHQPFIVFKYRVSLDKIDSLKIGGDVNITMVTVTDPQIRKL